MRLLSLFENPEMRGLALDDPMRVVASRHITRSKPLLRDIYMNFYERFLEVSQRVPEGTTVELGSGGGFFSELLPSTVTSDIQIVPHVDICFDAECIPFRDESISAIFLLNVFHHIKDPEKFFRDVERCLKHEGRLVMIEPSNTMLGRFVRRFLPEPFDPDAPWKMTASFGPLTGANMALPWIVFERDRDYFEKQFPNLLVVCHELHTPLRFIVSGGVGFRSFIPFSFLPLVKFTESVIKKFGLLGWFGMHVTIEIIKKKVTSPQ